MPDSKQPIVDFLTRVAHAFGIDTPIDVEDTPDGPRFNMTAEEAELLARHRGEPLKALGETTVPIRIHREVTAQLRVRVVPE